MGDLEKGFTCCVGEDEAGAVSEIPLGRDDESRWWYRRRGKG